MATSSHVQLSLSDRGVFHTSGITKESAAKASAVLQDNHERHHIFFNQSGFHSTYNYRNRPCNIVTTVPPSRITFSASAFCRYVSNPTNILTDHIAHHVLTIYALGATPDEIQQHYDKDKSYQRPLQPIDNDVLKNLHDCKKFHDYLGNERYYHDYLVFFRSEIDKKGSEEVIKEYILSGDERAEDMLVRLHAGTFSEHSYCCQLNRFGLKTDLLNPSNSQACDRASND